jgi:hypothetical protein
MQTRPTSFGFALLLGFLAALPYFGIDINFLEHFPLTLHRNLRRRGNLRILAE